MSTSRAIQIFRYFVHPGLALIPLFLGPTGAAAKGSHLPRANYASGALSQSPFRSPAFCRPAVTNGTPRRLILDQQNDIVRRIPYSRLTSLFFNAGRSIGDKIALADGEPLGGKAGPAGAMAPGPLPAKAVRRHALLPRRGNKHDRGGLFVPVGRH